jgi:hypothetical protein
MAPLTTIPDLAELHIDIIRDDEDIFARVEFIKRNESRYSISRQIHKCLGLDSDNSRL